MNADCDGGALLAHELVLRHVSAVPDRPAIIAGDEVVHYGELGERVAAIAEGLRRRGVGKGDRVVLLVPMSPELYLLVLAIVALGATVVFVEPASTLAEMARVIKLTRPKAFVAIPKAHALRLAYRDVGRVPLAVAVASPLVARALGAVALSSLEREGRGAALPAVDIAPDDPALLTFSSGSTGTAKGAPRSHAFLAAQHAAVERLLDRRPGTIDVDISAFAIVVLSTLCSGMTAVLPPLGRGGVNDIDGAELVRAIERHGVTTLSGSPSFLAPIFDAARGRHLFSVRRVASGGAPVPVSMCEAADETLLPRGSFLVVYGSTEAEPIATIDAAEVRAETADRTRAGDGLCVGLPAPGIELRLLAAADGPLLIGPDGIDGLSVRAPGHIGEVAVTGSHVNRRYYRNREAERATKLVDEAGTVWHRTGDAAYLDERGRLWIVGRIADIVRRGDAAYHPAAAEAAAMAVPGVERAALIPNGAGGTRLVVQASPRHRNRAAIVSRLADAGIPIDDVAFARALPVDTRHRAKLDYRAIRQEYSS